MKRVRVLLADDEPAILDLAKRVLERKFEVVGATADGDSLLAAARMLRPDIIISEITMPGLSGFDVASQLAVQENPPRFIFFTSLVEPEIVEKALALGASGYVLKPSSMSDLVQAVDTAMRGEIFISPTLPWWHT